MKYFHTCIIKFAETDGCFDAEYLKVLKKLEADIKTSVTVLQKEEIFDAFVYNYTVIPAIWGLILSHKKHDSYEFVNITKFLKRSLPDLYFYMSIFDTKFSSSEYYPWKNKILFSKCYESLRDYYINPEYYLLTFPHSQMENEYKKCDEYSHLPIPKEVLQKYKKAKDFAKRLLNENLIYTEWIEVLFEWDDPKFAIQKIENKLRKKIWDKSLWKAYINSMKTRNLKIVLNIYHRYTGLFLSDLQMKKEYETMKNGINKNDEYDSLPELEFYLFDEMPKKLKHYNFLNTFKHPQIQYYCFPKVIIQYILDCSKASLRLNLFKSCKSLFLQNSTPICHQLCISHDFKSSKYLLQSLQIRGVEENDLKAISKLYIANRLEIKHSHIETLQQVIIPKLNKCEARFFSISQQVISLQDFKFLVDPLRTEKFYFDNGGITNIDGSAVNLRLILESLSNAYSIGIEFNQKYELSSTKLSGLKRNGKIQSLWLKHFNELLNLEDYCNFIVENASPNAKIGLGFSDKVTPENAKAFNKAVNEFILPYFSEKVSNDFVIGYSEKFLAINLTKIVHRKIGFL